MDLFFLSIPNKLSKMFLKEEQKKAEESKKGSSRALSLSLSLSLSFPRFDALNVIDHIPTLETPLSDSRTGHVFNFFNFNFFFF